MSDTPQQIAAAGVAWIASLQAEPAWAAVVAALSLLRPVAEGKAVIVPVEPTETMIAAGWIDKEDVDPDDIYRAMLAAAQEG